MTVTFGLSSKEGIQKKLILGSAAPNGGVYAMLQGQDLVFAIERKDADVLEHDIVAPAAPGK
jgi:hypothetical protein